MAMATPTLPSYHQKFTPTQGIVQMEHLLHLYIHQITQASQSPNERNLLSSSAPNSFGALYVHDWVIRDGPTTNSNVVGRAQGLHCSAGVSKQDWIFCDNLIFTDESYNGSTIEFLGKNDSPLGSEGDLAIIGGTGEFTCAQGVISYKIIQRNEPLIVTELNIRALCLTFPKPNPVIPIDKTELLGGSGGDAFDISGTPKRLESATIRSGDVIDSIAFSYVDQAGQKQTAGPWGGNGGLPNTILFAPTETVSKLFGTTGLFGRDTVVTSLTIATNVKTYGPFGKGNGTPFSIPSDNTKSVVGLFARAGLVVDAIGAYVGPSATN